MLYKLPPSGFDHRTDARRDFEHSPLIVFYEVTQACDLVCQHCRACAQTRPHPGELSTAEAWRLIEQLTEFPKPPMLVLTGGDPLKRPDIYQLIEHAADRDLDVSITPSATPLVTPLAIRRLRDAGISRLAVSLDGSDAPTHDWVRGFAGSFDRTMEILGDARATGLPTQVNTTLSPVNFNQIDAMAELLARQQIVLWSVFFLVPVGRAADSPRLSGEQYEEAFERLWRQTNQQRYKIKSTEAPHYRRFVLERQRELGELHSPSVSHPAGVRSPSMGVNDGRGVMFVGRTGLIYPSGFLPITCGLFPLDHVVHVYQQSPVFRALRDSNRLEGKCGVCEYRNICGGSRARSFAVTDNAFAEEPDCEYIPVKLRGSSDAVLKGR